jgi:replicative DNA helicase
MFALEKVSDFLRPCHFYAPVHQRLYEVILTLTERGQITGPVTLKNYFETDGELAHVGGAQYLADLAGRALRPHDPGPLCPPPADRPLSGDLARCL